MADMKSQINKMIATFSKEMAAAYPGLNLFFITHKTGKLRESIALAEHEIISHPAGSAGCAILRKHANTGRSSFLGLAIASERKMMGFKRETHMLGLFNINEDEFKSEEALRAQFYHMLWHAIDIHDIREQPQYQKKFKNGPMVPKRSPMNLAKAHLQADAFAIVLSALKKQDNLIPFLSEKRSLDALLPDSNVTPEDYPSVIAIEACRMALDDVIKRQIAPEDHIKIARQFATDIGHAFDEQNIKQWWNFAIPAQDMAWRGFTPEDILGAAIHTSQDAYVRSTGYLVQESANVEPTHSSELGRQYNAFIDPEILIKLHRELVDTIFKEAVTQGMEEESGRALLNAANKLNENLTEGQILGWCSNALQDAAKAFDKALNTGTPPDQAARMQFQGNKNHPKWETLKNLGKKIIEQKKQGFAVTMGHVAEICHNNNAFAPVLGAMKITMNDPAYIQKLEAANDFTVENIPAPVKPLPRGPAPTAAPQAPAPSAPGLGSSGGGNNAGKQAAYQRHLAEKRAKEEAEQRQGELETQE